MLRLTGWGGIGFDGRRGGEGDNDDETRAILEGERLPDYRVNDPESLHDGLDVVNAKDRCAA
jgi:hypothetical protein